MSRLLLISLCFLWLTGSAALATEREFGSIGAQVVPTETGEVVVLQLVKGAPADRAGLRPGDLIVRINGVDLKGLDFKTVTREHLWGYVGEAVRLSWLRPGEAGRRDAELVRVRIDTRQLRHPEVRMLEPDKQ